MIEYTPVYFDGWKVGKRTKTSTKPLSQNEVMDACKTLNLEQKRTDEALRLVPGGCPECLSPEYKHSGGYIGADGSEIKTYICLNCGESFSHTVKTKD